MQQKLVARRVRFTAEAESDNLCYLRPFFVPNIYFHMHDSAAARNALKGSGGGVEPEAIDYGAVW